MQWNGQCKGMISKLKQNYVNGFVKVNIENQFHGN